MKNLYLCIHCDQEKKNAGIPFSAWCDANKYQPCAQCHGIGNIPPEIGYQQALLPTLRLKNPETRPSA